MLKGHTKIELTNVNTGHKRVVEHHNMITNALADRFKLFSQMNGLSMVSSTDLPIYEKALGGIMLFEEPLDENADKYVVPRTKDNKIIGYASSDVNPTTDTKRGSRNLTESMKLVNGYKFVWDFSTAQGNGQISSLALTHYLCGMDPRGNGARAYDLTAKQDCSRYYYGHFDNIIDSSIESDDWDYLMRSVDFNWDTGVLLSLDTKDDTTINVRKYRWDIGTGGIGLFDKYLLTKKIYSGTISTQSQINASTIWLDGKDGYAYGIYINNGKGEIVRVNKSSLTFDSTYRKSVDLGTRTWTVKKSYAVAERRMKHIIDGYLYIIFTDGVGKINLSDTSQYSFTPFNESVSYSQYFSSVYRNGLVYAGNVVVDIDSVTWRKLSIGSRAFIYTNNESYGNSDEIVFISDSGLVVTYAANSSSHYFAIGQMTDYLGTINNLDAPVTKTSQDVMKITYTLTEV